MTQATAKVSNGSNNGHGLEGFRILDELARSPKGITYKAVRQVEHDTVAVKSFRQRLCDKKFVGNLIKNAEATFFLEHPHLVRSLGCSNENNKLLLIMDFAPGEALARKLKQKLPIGRQQCLKIILQCAEALHYAAGKGRFHGRLHPGDILVGEEHVRVIGVGLGERPEHPAWSANEGYLFEPLIYCAPEALPSQPFPEGKSSEAAVDIYALGGIAFQLLTGAPPFKSTDVATLVAERGAIKGPVEWPPLCDVPLPLRSLVERMLAPEAVLRPTYEVLIPALKELFAVAEQAPALQRSAALGGIREISAPRIEVAAPYVPPSVYLPPRPANSAEYARRNSGKEKWAPTAWTLVLAVLTAVVFTFAMTITYFHAIQTSPAMVSSLTAPPAPAAETVKPPLLPVSPKKETTRSAALPDDSAPLVAARQLEMIEDMLKRGETRQTAALLRVVKQIAEALGKDTPNGMRAVILAAEIEETLARNYRPLNTEAAPLPPPAQPAPQPAAPPGDAKALADSTPAPAPAKAEAPAVAKPEFPGAPQDAQTAEAFSAAFIGAMNKACVMQYDAAAAELEKLGPDKKWVTEFVALLRQEEALVQRCRKRLLNDVERNPKKESPLTVKRKNGTIIEDIMDFDDRGLRLNNRAEQKTRVLEWEAVPKLQAYGMMLKLADPKNADDVLALCVMSFTRRLVDEHEAALQSASALPAAKDKLTGLSEVCKAVGGLVSPKN